MVKHPVPRAPDSSKPDRPTKAVTHEPQASPEQLQAIAHSRGRICKKRNCKVCEPLRETRRLKKAQRKADAQAKLHAKGQPCGRNSCELDVCVAARNAAPAGRSPGPAAIRRIERRSRRGTAPASGAASHRSGVRGGELPEPAVRRRLRGGTRPPPPGASALQVARVRQPDLRRQSLEPLTIPAVSGCGSRCSVTPLGR